MLDNLSFRALKESKEGVFLLCDSLLFTEALIIEQEVVDSPMKGEKKSANAVHLPPELVDLIDEAMEKAGGYSSRAEFVREAIRSRCFTILGIKTSDSKKRRGLWP